MAVCVDSPDRLANLDITIKLLRKNFPTSPVILVEGDTTSRITERYKNCTHVFEQSAHFNKMRLYNKAAALADSSVLCFIDADVPPNKKAILMAYELITNNTYDIVFPYKRAEGYNIPRSLHNLVEAAEDIFSYDESKLPWLSKSFHISYVESGGIVLFNAATYLHGGGGNEDFVGWGCEDDEMLARFTSLGYRIGRVDGAMLLHLDHTRKTGQLWYNAFNGGTHYERANRARLDYIKEQSRGSLLNLIKTWNTFGSPSPKKEDITVIISASHLDSHPEITFIKEVIESLDLTGLSENTPVLLSHDQLKPGIEGYDDKQKSYEEYFANLEQYVKTSPRNLQIVKAPEWGHLTRSLKNAVSLVETEYMLVLQHDIHIRREIPVAKMLKLMKKYKRIKHLRFNVRKNFPIFMWWDGYCKDGKCLFGEEEYDGVKLCVTPAWSDQNHLATKEYYENVVFPDCTNDDGELIYDFMENRLNGMCHHNHSRYGTYIYGEYGAPRTSRHSDGRKSSPEKDED